MPVIRQTNFLGGELGPLLHGRTELAVFNKGRSSTRMISLSSSRWGTVTSGFTPTDRRC